MHRLKKMTATTTALYGELRLLVSKALPCMFSQESGYVDPLEYSISLSPREYRRLLAAIAKAETTDE